MDFKLFCTCDDIDMDSAIPFESSHSTGDLDRLCAIMDAVREVAADHYGHPCDTFLTWRPLGIDFSVFCLASMAGCKVGALVSTHDFHSSIMMANEINRAGIPVHDIPVSRFA